MNTAHFARHAGVAFAELAALVAATASAPSRRYRGAASASVPSGVSKSPARAMAARTPRA